MGYQKQALAYCSNVHPGATLSAVQSNIQQHFGPVREKRGLEKMASGLWLSAEVAKQLINNPQQLAAFAELLKAQGVNLTSLNGFPYGDFHQAVVKQKVYLPTWAEPSRLEYSLQLAQILAYCLPEHTTTGAISTLPLAYAEGWTQTQQQQAIEHLLSVSKGLAEIEQRTGKRIILCIEMEPDCVLQYTEQLIEFFHQGLLPAAKRQGIEPAQVLRYLGCCYDTCHQAVMGEDVGQSLLYITDAGIAIGKIQVSNAVQASINATTQIDELVATFADNKFLHQTKVYAHNQLVASLADLGAQQLEQVRQHWADGGHAIDTRIHYHIPIHQGTADLPLDYLAPTQDAILSTLDFLRDVALPRGELPYLEVETYTWLNFLADHTDPVGRLHRGFVDEFNWLEQQLDKRGLLQTV